MSETKKVKAKASKRSEEKKAAAKVEEEAKPDVRDWVRAIKCQIKDKSRRDKIKQIVEYSVQEAIKQAEKVKVTQETFKDELFRSLVMQRIEASLRFAGFVKTIAVFGRDFAYDCKSSKNSLFLFQVGVAGTQPQFHILIYDLAYINLASPRVFSSEVFQKQLNLGKKACKVKEDEKLCPNKVVQAVDEIVCDADSTKMPEVILQALDDTIEYCAAHFGKEKSFPDEIELLILSRIYALTPIHADKNYSWHIICSEVHETNQASHRALFSNHQLLLQQSRGSTAGSAKDGNSVTECADKGIHLKFFTRRVCQFKVQNQSKRFEVIIFNQNFEPPSTLDILQTDGFMALMPSFTDVMTFRGISLIAFLVFCFLLMFSNSICSDMKASKFAAEQSHELEDVDAKDLTDVLDEVIVRKKEMEMESTEEPSWRQMYCHNQESAVGQLAILIMIMTAVRLIMTKGMERAQAQNNQKKTKTE